MFTYFSLSAQRVHCVCLLLALSVLFFCSMLPV